MTKILMAAVSMLGLTTDCAHVESKSAFLLWETLLNTRKILARE